MYPSRTEGGEFQEKWPQQRRPPDLCNRATAAGAIVSRWSYPTYDPPMSRSCRSSTIAWRATRLSRKHRGLPPKRNPLAGGIPASANIHYDENIAVRCEEPPGVQDAVIVLVVRSSHQDDWVTAVRRWKVDIGGKSHTVAHGNRRIEEDALLRRRTEQRLNCLSQLLGQSRIRMALPRKL